MEGHSFVVCVCVCVCGKDCFVVQSLVNVYTKTSCHNHKHYTVKISTYRRIFLASFFYILTKPVPYTFVSVNRGNNEARAATLQCGPRGHLTESHQFLHDVEKCLITDQCATIEIVILQFVSGRQSDE